MSDTVNTISVRPCDIEDGDIIQGWTDSVGSYNYTEGPAEDWTVDGSPIVRPEDSPSFRRHKHGFVQVCFEHAYISFAEDDMVDVIRN